MKRLLILFFVVGAFSNIMAQEPNEMEKLEGHFLGVQVNELVRQVFSLGSSTSPSNPYFFNYTYTSESGGGFSSSFAYSLDNITNTDNFNSIESEISRFALRVGYEKKKTLSKRFIYSLGVDFLIESTKNETTNEDGFSSQTITTTNQLSGWGLGPRFNFYYRVNDRILVGTEANYYYKSLKEKFETDFDDNFSSNDDDDERTVKQFTFSSPAILWLTIRF